MKLLNEQQISLGGHAGTALHISPWAILIGAPRRRAEHDRPTQSASLRGLDDLPRENMRWEQKVEPL